MFHTVQYACVLNSLIIELLNTCLLLMFNLICLINEINMRLSYIFYFYS